MTKRVIHNVLIHFRSLSWAARQLGVDKSILSRWLKGEKASFAIEAGVKHLESLAREVERTKGNCSRDNVRAKKDRRS